MKNYTEFINEAADVRPVAVVIIPDEINEESLGDTTVVLAKNADEAKVWVDNNLQEIDENAIEMNWDEQDADPKANGEWYRPVDSDGNPTTARIGIIEMSNTAGKFVIEVNDTDSTEYSGLYGDAEVDEYMEENGFEEDGNGGWQDVEGGGKTAFAYEPDWI